MNLPDPPLSQLGITDRAHGALLGSRIGDALAMPVHWYYDTTALREDYGWIEDYLDAKNPHSGSIFWRSSWKAPSPELDILGSERPAWGQRGVHYHQNLKAGENTLTTQLATMAWERMVEQGEYRAEVALDDYMELLTHPERHRDTYLEECHRGFFTNLGRGMPPNKCAVSEKHIGGIAAMLSVAIYYAEDPEIGREMTLKHLALTHAGKKMVVAADAILSLLYPVLGGASLGETIEKEIDQQRNPHFGFPFRKWVHQEGERVIGPLLSKACYVEDAIPATIYLALKYHHDFEAGLIANTNRGGDNVHRGSVLGALLGAANGTTGFPERWKRGLVNSPSPISHFGDSAPSNT